MEARRWQGRAERREAVGSSAQGGEEEYRKTGARQRCMAKRQAEQQGGGEGAGILDRSSRNMAAGSRATQRDRSAGQRSEETRGEGQ